MTEKESKKDTKKVNNKELVELKKKYQELESINKDLLTKLQYSQAELINYRTRKDKEVEDRLEYANEELLKSLLPIIDNFERAIKLDDNDLTDELSKFLEGFKMIYATLSETLKSYGVEELDVLNKPFDPNTSNALLTDNVLDIDDDIVIDVMQKGYKYKDRILRVASVKVNKK